MVRKINLLFLFLVLSFLLIVACEPTLNKSSDVPVLNNSPDIQPSPKYETVDISLGQEFILHQNQSAKVKNEDYAIRLIDFYSVRCPEKTDIKCELAFLDEITFEHAHNGIVIKEMVRTTSPKEKMVAKAFGYQTIVLDTDPNNYTKLRIERNQKYCKENSDCAIVPYGGCGTSVVNKEAAENNKESAENWESSGPTCIAGRYAKNPRCENSECVADFDTY